jgi:hypothetical protein
MVYKVSVIVKEKSIPFCRWWLDISSSTHYEDDDRLITQIMICPWGKLQYANDALNGRLILWRHFYVNFSYFTCIYTLFKSHIL